MLFRLSLLISLARATAYKASKGNVILSVLLSPRFPSQILLVVSLSRFRWASFSYSFSVAGITRSTQWVLFHSFSISKANIFCSADASSSAAHVVTTQRLGISSRTMMVVCSWLCWVAGWLWGWRTSTGAGGGGYWKGYEFLRPSLGEGLGFVVFCSASWFIVVRPSGYQLGTKCCTHLGICSHLARDRYDAGSTLGGGADTIGLWLCGWSGFRCCTFESIVDGPFGVRRLSSRC